MPQRDKKEHKCNPAVIREKILREEEIRNFKPKEEIMTQEIMLAKQEKQPPIIALMESPERAVEIYDNIKKNFYKLLTDNGEVIQIKGKDYVKYEGWQTIGTAMGILPRIVEIVRLDGSYQAKAEAVLVKTGAVIGSGFAICSREEPNWKDKPEFALLAMAQTRASGRALKMILSGMIAHLGFEPTLAEEMIEENGNQQPIIKHTAKETVTNEGTQVEYTANEIPAGGCTEKQQKAIWAILKNKGLNDEQIKTKLAADYGIEHTRQLTKQQASEIIELYGK